MHQSCVFKVLTVKVTSVVNFGQCCEDGNKTHTDNRLLSQRIASQGPTSGWSLARGRRRGGGPKKSQNVTRGKTALVQTFHNRAIVLPCVFQFFEAPLRTPPPPTSPLRSSLKAPFDPSPPPPSTPIFLEGVSRGGGGVPENGGVLGGVSGARVGSPVLPPRMFPCGP